ncbi:MAG: hypothetical protein JW772_00715, partial [Candidatus Diapherotrites archaeon]|nr:hypothetical protein [Candidatus Diapherotrites archaeon]
MPKIPGKWRKGRLNPLNRRKGERRKPLTMKLSSQRGKEQTFHQDRRMQADRRAISARIVDTRRPGSGEPIEAFRAEFQGDDRGP